MNQSKQQVASLTSTTSRLSPLAKPFTLNRTPYSSPKPCADSLDHCCDDDPFSSLLDSFRKSNLASKAHSVPLDHYVTTTTTLPVEAASQHPFLELPKNGDFDSHFGVSLSTNSPCIASLGYETGNGNGVGSVGDASTFQKGKHAVVGLNPYLRVSDGTFEKSTGTIVPKDILPNSEGTIQAVDESNSFLISSSKVAPLKLLTDMSSLKNTPQNQFSNNLDDSETDVDSPCWKGTKTFNLTPSEILGSVQFHHVEKATEKSNSLNPLAPQFIPGIGYIKDDFVSSNSRVPVARNLLSGEDILMKTVTEESLVELNKGAELQHCSNTCGREKAFNVLDPKSSSVDPVLNSHCPMTQSSSKEECMTSKGKLVTIGDIDDFVKGTKNSGASRSMSEVFPTKGHSPTSLASSSQANVVTDLLKTFEGFSKSLLESPKPDVKIMVGAMHVLSEMLVQASVDGVDSYSEHDPNMILLPQIINNLNDFSTKKCGQRISTLHSTPANSHFCLESLDRSLMLTKGLEMASIDTLAVPHQLYLQNDCLGKNTVSKVIGQSGQSSFASSSDEGTKKGNEIAQGLEMASVDTLAVPHQLYLQNDYLGINTVSKVIGQSGQSSFASSSDEGTKKGNEIAQLQVIRRSLGKSLDFDKQMQPEALLFWNLWLDSESERCYRKYKTYHLLMEAGVDVNCKNVAELWR